MPEQRILAIAAAIVFVAYSATIRVALDLRIADALLGGLANTVPVVLFGIGVRFAIVRWLAGRNPIVQAFCHLLLCAAFSALSLWLLVVLLGLVNGASPIEFSVRPFPAPVAAWQTLENVTTYGALAALSYLPAGRHLAPAAVREPEPSRFFIRSGEDLRPVDFARIVCIAGADDYAEVTTLDGKHLVRMTLAEFGRKLDASRYARVHRSWIVNLDRVDRVEPAGGGRMLLHMSTGDAVPASRSGARLLRDRVI